jgi:hypothetical protein
VDIALASPEVPTYHQSRAKATLFITATKAEPFRPEDVVLDDFDDGDSLNALKAPWSIFTDKALQGVSYVNPPSFGPAIFAVGDDKTKDISVRIVGAAGAPKPMAGIRTRFNAAGTAVSLGAAKSVVFDVKAAAGSRFRVELEQPDIAEAAYHGFDVNVGTDAWTRLRIPFSAFAQPAWKTAAKPFNPGSVTALRFAYYGEGTVRFDLDNVRVEGMKLGPAALRPSAPSARRGISDLRAAMGEVSYRLDEAVAGPALVSLSDVRGRVRYARVLGPSADGSVVLSGLRLERGRYLLRHAASDGRAWTQSFWVF